MTEITLARLRQSGLLTPPEPEKPPAPEPEQTIHGSVIGYRAWRIQDWQLYGTGVNRAWVPGVNEATCDAGPGTMTFAFGGMSGTHPAPAPGCHCGITALARFAEHDTHWAADCIRGAIEAWSEELVDVPGPGDVAEATEVITGWSPEQLKEALDGYEVTDGPHTRIVKQVYPEVAEVEQHYAHARKKREPGRFILHGTGFRAQFGKIVLLAVDPEWPSAKRAAVRALAAEHEADVCRPSHLEDAAKEHGQLVPDELLKWAAEGDTIPPGDTIAWRSLSLYFSARSSSSPPTGWVAVQQPYLTQPIVYSGSPITFAWSTAPITRPKRAKGPRPTGKPGISQTLGYPGPPADPTSKFSKGQRVRDSKGVVWACVKGGKPGLWEAEAE